MNNQGFTLMELLVVIVILVVTGVSSTIIFDTASSSNEEEDLTRLYASVQRAGEVYLDLNDSWMNSFLESGEVYIKVSELEDANYYNTTYEGVKSSDSILPSYFVKVFINKLDDKPYVDSCLIKYDSSNNAICIADKDGNASCNYSNKCLKPVSGG